ncbi:MAG: restriction endonuclease subunit S [Prevotella sp.]|nr:restriction endonuclease subunit S [Prevotella sp.]
MTFGNFVNCNPTIKAKRDTFVENCDMEDIVPSYKFLYPQKGKIYKGSGSKFQNGDTVFSRITPCLENGKIAQIKGIKGKVGIGSTEFFVFRGKPQVSDNDFVYYLAKTHYIRKSAENSMVGASGRQRADLNFIKNLKIKVPKDIIDQQKIAQILSHYDDLIEVNKHRIALLEKSAHELYKEWFVRMRFPGWEKTRFVDGIPEGWKEKTLEDFCRIFTGRKDVNASEKNGNYLFFTCGEIPLRINSYIHEGPAIIITGNGSYTGRTSFFEGRFDLYQRTYACVLKKDINPYFIYGLFQFVNNSLKEEISTKLHGAAIPYIVLNDITHFHFLFNNKILEEFSKISRSILHEIQITKNINFLLRKICDRLLPRLMSGRLEV